MCGDAAHPILLEVEDDDLTRFEIYFAAEVVIPAREDIFGTCGSANHFLISGGVEVFGCLGAIEDGHHGASLILSRDDIHAIYGDEMGLRTLGDHLITLAPMEQAAKPVKHGILGLGAPLGSKGTAGIAREATGEVFAHVSICNALGTIH